MGNYLTSPNSIKNSQNGVLGRFKYGSCAMQGWRVSMEDAHLIHYFERLDQVDMPAALFGVYDGHGGPQVAQFVSRHLVNELVKNPDFRRGRFDAAFRAVYVALDVLLAHEESQRELEWFSRNQLSRDPVELESTPFPPISQTTSPEAMTLMAAKNSQASTVAHDCSTPQKGGFRSSVRLGGKMFHKRAERRRKTDEVLGSPIPDAKSVSNKEVIADDSTDTGDTVGVVKLDSGCKQVDETNSAPERMSSSSTDPTTSHHHHNSTAKTNGAETLNLAHQNDFTIGGNSLSPTHSQPLPLQGRSQTQVVNGGSPNFFSLSGIRALFSGMMKLGSSGRTPQSNQGLAMLAGCTAVSVLVTGKQVVVANAGDSRCVLCRGSVAVELSKDHKPQLPEERSRIYSAGGWLEMGRVNGNLNLSRALGDLIYKVNTALPPDRQIVSSVPDVIFADLIEQDEFLILGCDGIWESTTSQEIVDFIRERIGDALQLSDILEVLFEELLSPNPTLFEFGCDNMTAIIVDLHPDRRPSNSRSSNEPTAAPITVQGRNLGAESQQTTIPARTNSCSPSQHQIRGREGSHIPSRSRSSHFSTTNVSHTSERDLFLVDRESFWEGHDGSPFVNDRSTVSKDISREDEYPTWEGVVAAFSAGSPTNPTVAKIAHLHDDGIMNSNGNDRVEVGGETMNKKESVPYLVIDPPNSAHRTKQQTLMQQQRNSSSVIPQSNPSSEYSSDVTIHMASQSLSHFTVPSLKESSDIARSSSADTSKPSPEKESLLSVRPLIPSDPSATLSLPSDLFAHTRSSTDSDDSGSESATDDVSPALLHSFCQQFPLSKYPQNSIIPPQLPSKGSDFTASLMRSTDGSDSRPVSLSQQSSTESHSLAELATRRDEK